LLTPNFTKRRNYSHFLAHLIADLILSLGGRDSCNLTEQKTTYSLRFLSFQKIKKSKKKNHPFLAKTAPTFLHSRCYGPEPVPRSAIALPEW